MNLIFNTCAKGFYVYEDPHFNAVPFGVGLGYGATVEEAKQNFLLKCRLYADALHMKAANIHNVAQDWQEHKLRQEK